jgi:uncharacterized protein
MVATAQITEYRAKLQAHFPDLADRYRLSSLAFFGSRVRGDERPDSDLDVLARFQETPSLFTILALENELSDLLGIKVDLVLHNSLRPAVARQVLSELVPL